ncbi:MAG: Ig-like domain-containing protein, partial [Ferruginibacter sp.]|nr:Ig-like domain-containing protein [Ferruginibacter sp.]
MKRTIATSKTFMKTFFLLYVLLACVSKIHAQRDPYLRPFANNSIWNMAIHNNAVYVDAKINAPTAWGVTGDPEIIILSPSAPNVGIFTAGWAGSTRCDKGAFITNAPIPDGWINGIPEGTPNTSTAILAQDGHTIINLQCLHRCATSGPASSLLAYPSGDLYTDGIQGGHGGSGMSALGGSIRVGELTPNYTEAQIIADANIYIKHVIKMNVNTKLYVSNTNGGYRWPAVKADGAYNYPGACDYYGGSVPQFKMGSLLAIPKSINVEAMGLTTAPGRIMARTLQKYGAYLVDATCWDVVAFECQTGPLGDEEARFASKYGYIFGRQSTTVPWAQDIAKIVQELFVVDNNNASNIGGGPTTDVTNRLAPAICNIGTAGSGIYDCGAAVAVTGVTVSPTTASVAAGATTTVTATVAPSNASNKNLSWTSSNTAIATVSTAGVVT